MMSVAVWVWCVVSRAGFVEAWHIAMRGGGSHFVFWVWHVLLSRDVPPKEERLGIYDDNGNL